MANNFVKEVKENCCAVNADKACGGCWGADFGKKVLWTFAGVLLVYAIFWLGTTIRNNIKQYDFIGKADKFERQIAINGYGKVSGSNDIAVTTIGHSNTDKDVSKAQAENKKVMDQILADLQTMGVADKDLQSNYTIYPDYNYTEEKGQVLQGYRVSNQLTVKIRDLSKVSAVLGLAGKYGATEVSGLNFTIDDPENLKNEARKKALEDAQIKAGQMAVALGVRLGGVISFSEWDASPGPYPVYSMMGAEKGGGEPGVASGSQDVAMNVSITYEILQ
ncbi:MAG: hypothetical protein A3J93_01685 [Candidatus Magasanikbacteria bacterium RIFOXYC2_FULL_42_28]|uniref:SIMPL domain-containing protein n=1 Tax=Candidatus Magasanikbacteria bacterium RIFOXYC2_FULL_42_28 TaxID=1798704 RepID=A0A1F6NXX3_9BACT|nr:MAG: hypothetical protein A3J93_01685 [Candidatus Magasanikbacteria bacterium RIFOXYC2_FULL_42_28]